MAQNKSVIKKKGTKDDVFLPNNQRIVYDFVRFCGG